MTLSAFDQFLSPVYLGVPLIALAILLPWPLLPTLAPAPLHRWLSNRLLSSQNWLIGWIVNQVILPLNPGGHKWAALFVSLMMFILSLNLLGLLPYTFTPTTQLSLSLGLAFPLWLATVIVGARNQPTEALAHLLPKGTPTLLIPVLIVIETISVLIRPLSLGVRLTANLTAGHLLIQLISSAMLFLLLQMSPAAIPTMIILFFLTLLETAVAVIQAYVFVLLLSLYLQENI
uniref:ATP synthase subunit a n=1 Tax=Zeugopterus punctatus TaxID=526623 RepID=A0A7G9M2I2_9PLEU|nr:ATP synthase F0 subunit 6 [Zeugopterus punctatus]QNM99550.1 ATP synthase F0 subunit 6 [Zeugopterus punctatus]